MKIIQLTILLILPATALAQTTAQELVEASIRYHDPNNQWPGLKAIMGFIDTRPGKADRRASFFINNPDGIHCIVRENDNVQITRHITADTITYELNGSETISEDAIKEYQLTSERSLMLRNYYLYLWGMPMKLKDEGTIINPVVYAKNFNNQKTNAIRVTYDAAVGSDIWYFYFDPGTNALVGYQFFHDEAKGDGEYIILDDRMTLNGLNIPKQRTWFTNLDSTLLGTDNLVHLTKSHNHH